MASDPVYPDDCETARYEIPLNEIHYIVEPRFIELTNESNKSKEYFLTIGFGHQNIYDVFLIRGPKWTPNDKTRVLNEVYAQINFILRFNRKFYSSIKTTSFA